MRKILIIIVIIATSGCASTRLEETLGKTWRTGAPENATLGGYGIRTVTRDGIIFTENGSISRSKLKTRKSKARTVKYNSKTEVETEVSKDNIATLNMSYDDILDKGYKVILTRIANSNEIAKQLPSGEDDLDSQYLSLSSLRFITGVAQIFDHEQIGEKNWGSDTTIDALEKFDGKIRLKVDTGEERKLNYDDGATVAYTYARICWNPDGTINYLQEEAPNPWYLFWSNRYDCAKGTLEEKPSSQIKL